MHDREPSYLSPFEGINSIRFNEKNEKEEEITLAAMNQQLDIVVSTDDQPLFTLETLCVHAYVSVLRALYAQSEFSWEKESIVFHLRRCLNISSQDDVRAHKTVLGDPRLIHLRAQNSATAAAGTLIGGGDDVIDRL